MSTPDSLIEAFQTRKKVSFVMTLAMPIEFYISGGVPPEREANQLIYLGDESVLMFRFEGEAPAEP